MLLLQIVQKYHFHNNSYFIIIIIRLIEDSHDSRRRSSGSNDRNPIGMSIESSNQYSFSETSSGNDNKINSKSYQFVSSHRSKSKSNYVHKETDE